MYKKKKKLELDLTAGLKKKTPSDMLFFVPIPKDAYMQIFMS